MTARDDLAIVDFRASVSADPRGPSVETLMDIPPVPAAVPPPAPRPVLRRRGLGGLVVQGAILTGLAWLTYENATTSRALVDAAVAEARGDDLTALRGATDHLDRRPWSRQASRIVARCLSRLDFADQAEPYYQRGGDLSVADLRHRAYGLTRVNLRERALLAFDDALARQPDDVASLRLKAGLLMSMTRWDDVARVGRTLAGLPNRPMEVDAPVAVGSHWTFRPREIASVPTIGATLEAIAFHNQGETEEAVLAYEKVLTLDPDLRSMPLDRRLFWSQFAEDLLSVGRASDMIRLLAIEDRDRSDPALVALLARAHSQLGSIDEAEVCWRRVLELDPAHPAAWRNLGRIASARGDHEEAARRLARAAELAPDSIDAAYNLGLTYRRLGREDEARKWEQEAARLRLKAGEKSPKPPPATPTLPLPCQPREPDHA